MLDLDNDFDILNKAGDALGGASSSTSQNNSFLNSSDINNSIILIYNLYIPIWTRLDLTYFASFVTKIDC